jgi:hypothetical protein
MTNSDTPEPGKGDRIGVEALPVERIPDLPLGWPCEMRLQVFPHDLAKPLLGVGHNPGIECHKAGLD